MRRGNVRREDPDEAPEFQPGDVVALTPSAIRKESEDDMTPKALYRLGWENRFLVLDTFVDPKHGPCISLYPCCRKFADREEGRRYRCMGHPAVHFEKVDWKRMPNKGDRKASVMLPFIPGDIASLEFEDSENPSLKFSLFGPEAVVTGQLARVIKEYLQGQKIL